MRPVVKRNLSWQSKRIEPPQITLSKDLLALPRDRVMFVVGLIGMCFFFPLIIHNFFLGRYALGSADVCLFIVTGVNVLALGRKKRPPLPYWWFLPPAALAITISLAQQGALASYWCFPAVLFMSFILPKRIANICSVALLAEASFAVHYYLGFDIALRFGMSMVLTIVIVNVSQFIILDLQAKLMQQTITDVLTGAFNRRHMETRLSETLEEGRRRSAAASLLMMDIDHFKSINDRLGHEAGDSVLRGFAGVVRTRARKLDLLFRIGGEEFVLLLPDTQEELACKVAEALRGAVESARLLSDAPVTVSIGVAGLHPEHTIDSWLKQADDAMYAAKHSGRNRVRRASTGPDLMYTLPVS